MVIDIGELDTRGAAAEPLAGGEAANQVMFSGGGGFPFFLEVLQSLEVFVLVFVGEHGEVAGGVGEPVAEIVAAEGGFTFGRDGASRVLRVGLVGGLLGLGDIFFAKCSSDSRWMRRWWKSETSKSPSSRGSRYSLGTGRGCGVET